jgi:hypothetical protein
MIPRLIAMLKNREIPTSETARELLENPYIEKIEKKFNKKFNKSIAAQMNYENIMSKRSVTETAKLLPFDKKGEPDSIISASFLDRQIQYDIIDWKLGRFSNGGLQCSNCHMKLSRKHAIDCSMADMLLKIHFPYIEQQSPISAIDQVLKKFEFKPENQKEIDVIWAAISMIKKLSQKQ